uniref:Tail tubular protein B n=4 Tax=unclassified bacterial viruses TaxID=12333 RepID=A0AAU6W1J9_9VIRU
MSGYEGAYSSILQGVSQQLPKLRLPGQVSAQDNMISDIVTNVRRRPGVAVKLIQEFTGESENTVRSWSTDIVGQKVHVFVGTATGRLLVLNDNYTTVLLSSANAYLRAPRSQDIRGTTVGDEFFLLNVNEQPSNAAVSEPQISPNKLGFFYIRAGTFSKTYSVTVSTNLGSVELSYTTPNGVTAGDAEKSTPEAVAVGLVNSNSAALTALNIGYTLRGAYVAFQSPPDIVTSLSVVSVSGSTYIQPSNNSKVRTESDLPMVLPPAWDGYIMSVGEQKVLRYYRYNNSRTEWIECGVYGSPTVVNNVPVSVTSTDGVFRLLAEPFEGRLAGDDETNEPPNFIGKRRLTGMGSFQNRLVLLCGAMVYLSASNKPRRFYRSTVVSLLDNDPIAVGSSANSSAEYKYAIPFQKDLLLFSDKYQALIPSTGQAVTPRTATVLLTSTYSADTLSEPVSIGRTLLFSAPRSQDFFGFMEMVSSQYTDGQYVANDATAHLPKYMGGACRFSVSSSVASMVLFSPSGDTSSLVVYEYSWDGDTKVQQAWHTWRFRYPICTAYFSNEVINIVFIKNGVMIGCTMDPRQGVLSAASNRRPYLDLSFPLVVTGNKCVVPASLVDFDPAGPLALNLAVAAGPLAGERVGIESYDAATRTITTVRSFPSGEVIAGFPYRSTLSPTPPIYQDRNGVKIESAKLTVLRFGVSTQNSSEYRVLVTDSTSEDAESIDQSTLRFCSSDLDLGEARYAAFSRAVIPARTDADTTTLVLYTEGTGELNITGLDYTGRFNTRIRRR